MPLPEPPLEFRECEHERQPTESGWKCDKCGCGVMNIYYDPLTHHLRSGADAEEETS